MKDPYGRELILIQTPTCIYCRNKSELEVVKDHYDAWKNGTLIQNAFPEVSADTREMLKTGIHPDCWDTMFKEEDDE